MELHTLICKRDITNGMLCLRTVDAALPGGARFDFHDDGSLDERDVAALQQAFPTATVHRRRDREREVLERLRRHPHCAAYRQVHPIAHKLLDIPLRASGRLRYIDSDVMFFRKVHALFPQEDRPISLREDDDGYSAPLLRLAVKYRLPLPTGFNAGLCSVDLTLFDLDRLEWFLSKPELMVMPDLAEQTCWAMLCGYRRLRQLVPPQFFCSRFQPARLSAETVAMHFIYHLKPLIPKLAGEAMQAISQSTPVEVKLSPARKLTVAHIVHRRLTRGRRQISALEG